MDWADRIKTLRKRLLLSQTEFAKILNVGFQTVNRWENRHFEPVDCDKALITLIEENQPAAERLLSIPLTDTGEALAERIKRVREGLGLSREIFAHLIRVSPQAVYYWEKGSRTSPSGCALRMLDLLEFHKEEAAPVLWPQLLKPGELESLSQRRDPCKRFMNLFLKTTGAEGKALLHELPVDDEWGADRVVELLGKLDLSPHQFAQVLGTRQWTIQYVWEVEGLKGQRAACWRTVLTLFERYPEEMMSIRKSWPDFI